MSIDQDSTRVDYLAGAGGAMPLAQDRTNRIKRARVAARSLGYSLHVTAPGEDSFTVEDSINGQMVSEDPLALNELEQFLTNLR